MYGGFKYIHAHCLEPTGWIELEKVSGDFVIVSFTVVLMLGSHLQASINILLFGCNYEKCWM